MKSISLSGSLREGVGKKDARNARKNGMFPAVVYGAGEQLHILLSEKDFNKVIFSPETYLVVIKVDGKEIRTILQEVQYHPVSDKVLHADFYAVTDDKPFTIAVPIKLTGTSKGVLKGGKLQQKVRKLHVSGLLKDFPDNILVDITTVDVGSPVRIEDLHVENLSFVDSKRNIVVDMKSARALAAEEEHTEEHAAEGAAPAAE
ncbi:MAG: 50S ribosomal protein L25 [Bacteroidales bacterium]|nr:50S ribosomal protein L25 [Bacteroidales bacterium]